MTIVPLLAMLLPLVAGAQPKASPPEEIDAVHDPLLGSTPANLVFLFASDMRIKASSTLCEGKKKKVCHDAERVADWKNETAWCEGAKGNGEGESLVFEWDEEREVDHLRIVAYYARDMRRAAENGRGSELELSIAGKIYSVLLPDIVGTIRQETTRTQPPGPEDGPCGDETCATQDERIESGEFALVQLPKPVKTRGLALKLTSVFDGSKYQDACISEVKIAVKRKPKGGGQ
jgi:hypothetical protein